MTVRAHAQAGCCCPAPPLRVRVRAVQDVERWIGGRFVAMPLRRFVTMPFCRYAARCEPFGPRMCARIAQLKRVVLCTGRLAAARALRATEDVRVRLPAARTRAATRGRTRQRLSRRRGWRCLSPGASRCRCGVRRDSVGAASGGASGSSTSGRGKSGGRSGGRGSGGSGETRQVRPPRCEAAVFRRL